MAVLLASASLLLSGVAYPTSVLPPWLQVAANLFPLTHALELIRGALLRGASLSELLRPLAAMALFAGLLAPAGGVLFVIALRRARVDGSLTHY